MNIRPKPKRCHTFLFEGAAILDSGRSFVYDSRPTPPLLILVPFLFVPFNLLSFQLGPPRLPPRARNQWFDKLHFLGKAACAPTRRHRPALRCKMLSPWASFAPSGCPCTPKMEPKRSSHVFVAWLVSPCEPRAPAHVVILEHWQ